MKLGSLHIIQRGSCLAFYDMIVTTASHNGDARPRIGIDLNECRIQSINHNGVVSVAQVIDPISNELALGSWNWLNVFRVFALQ